MKNLARTMRSILAIMVITGTGASAQQPGVRSVARQPGVVLQAENTSMSTTVAQVKDDLFAGTEKFAAGASDVTEINLDPKMMGMIGDKKGGSDLARKMKFMVIHTYTYDKPGMYRMEDFEAYRKRLEDGTWSCAIHVREKDGSTDICTRTAPDHEGNEMVILTAEPKELTFIHMSGNMSLDELSKMHGDGTDKGKTKLKER